MHVGTFNLKLGQMRLDRITSTTNILKKLVEIYMTLKRINAGHGVREYDMLKRKQEEDGTKTIAHRALLEDTKHAIYDLVQGNTPNPSKATDNTPRSIPSMKEIYSSMTGGAKPQESYSAASGENTLNTDAGERLTTEDWEGK
jgi:hypothetical protein